MNVVPKRSLSAHDVWEAEEGALLTGELRPVLWLPDGEGLVIECVISSPPSAKGRNVDVWIRGDEVEHFMKELREVAIARRNRPMESELKGK